MVKRIAGRNGMWEKGVRAAVNILVRMIVGIAMIFLINQFLDTRGIEAQVGMNPVTVLTSGILGVPGVALLYGVTFYGIM